MYQRFPRSSLRWPRAFDCNLGKVGLVCACSLLEFWRSKDRVTFLKYLERVYSIVDKFHVEFRDSNELLKSNMHFSNYTQWWNRIDKKTARASLKPRRKDLQIETLGNRNVENFVGAENKRNTTSVAS